MFVFAIIWLIFGVLYALIEVGLLGSSMSYPTTGNYYNFKSNLVVIGIGSLLMGLAQGWLEVVWLRKRFEKKALWIKVLSKSLIYLALSILFLVITTALIATFNLHNGQLELEVLEDVKRFMSTFSFWSIIIYIGVILNIALLFSEIKEYMGSRLLYDFILGRYHRPNQEIRIFMFLDMKSSTTIAENMGHAQYFQLIKTYYADMTDPILETNGEIYQYVGDEIVVSWSETNGFSNNNCIDCFRRIEKELLKKSDSYLKKFGLVPSFKAGFHIGEVTTGEIGIIKKDIIYTGDVLNTTARIQAECNNYEAKVLLSKDLLKKLPKESDFSFTKIGKLTLRGKSEEIKLYSVDF
nr:adenylate cyclase [uncultured bacterium]